ncbi:hypothetical protein GA0070624_0149 [Micromonospora rhizosphaerae]|uniref:Uncharacterized protein n=1 Tax=Micromonospora rhizosphaerae TaxID=568872 RepID=A0A1C6R8R8_9ACTN|nr:hypothetical protein [Micromonospora rhizosphaerae]SCL13494.1 hypothetical protein GA0070624_0149 [Micromonospora rhizosphaerae]
MSADWPYGVDRTTAERLLGGDVTNPHAGPDALVRLLAATRAQAQPGEWAGEEAAMDAFRTAHLGPGLQPRRRSMLETALAKLLTLKVAGAAAVAVVATGGVALAAANGVLPNPMSGNANVQPSPHATGKSSEQAGKPSAEAKVAASPSPSLVGLCRAYKAGAGDNPGKALENPAFGVLITTAGDKEKVAAYCDTLLAQKDTKTTPTARPTEARPSHTAGKPDSAPTSVPSKPAGGGHPTATPTARPTS